MSRHYNYLIGRFYQPDSVNGSISSPLSWNLYSYVQNNPMNFVDPYGFRKMGEGSSRTSEYNEKKSPKEQCEEDGGRYENCLCIFQDGTAKIYDAKEFENYIQKNLLRIIMDLKNKRINVSLADLKAMFSAKTIY